MDEISMTREELLAKYNAGERDFHGANLHRMDLYFVDLRGVNLSEADLRGTNLSGTNLSVANLSDANLSDANLARTDLCGANLRGANLSEADLYGANLSEADLRGANLDYSVMPLRCGGLDWKIDRRIAAQLAYHLCSMDCDDPEFRVLRSSLLDFANTFHKVGECGKLLPEQNQATSDTATERREKNEAAHDS